MLYRFGAQGGLVLVFHLGRFKVLGLGSLLRFAGFPQAHFLNIGFQTFGFAVWRWDCLACVGFSSWRIIGA